MLIVKPESFTKSITDIKFIKKNFCSPPYIIGHLQINSFKKKTHKIVKIYCEKRHLKLSQTAIKEECKTSKVGLKNWAEFDKL